MTFGLVLLLAAVTVLSVFLTMKNPSLNLNLNQSQSHEKPAIQLMK
jgi:hypothetical protein